ncbi:DNA primase [Patescibacteria group bacterium]|nr:DNA primase [Patescibacteria group bacterium]
MANEVDEIKSRLDVVDVVSEYVRLKQAGTNWKANCPFHSEKTPSFMVSKEKQIWHCFGCGEGGDIFSFVQRMENIEFPEALRLLAQKAGVKIQYANPQIASQKNKLLDICQLTAKYWHNNLLKSDAAKIARDYLQERQVEENIIEEFQIGYAPDSWDQTSKFLIEKGYKEQEIFLAGLTVKKDRGEGFYDRFRGRLIFSILNPHGDIIAFGARTLKNEDSAKYINSPQTLIYNKSLVLYNLDKAKQEIKRLDYAILVEGYTDIVASYQTGIKNVIASSGTALTLEQIKLIKRYTNNLAIAYDADLAGEAASARGIDLAISEGLNVKIISLPEGKDPDDLIREDQTKWQEAIKNAQSIIEFHFKKTLKDLDLSKVENKKKAAKELLTVISKLNDKIEQTHWLQKLAEKLNTPEEILREVLPKKITDKVEIQESIKEQPKDRMEILSQQILAIALKYPQNLDYISDHLKPEVLMGDNYTQLYKKLLVYYTENNEITDEYLLGFNQSLKNEDNYSQLNLFINTLILLAEKEFFDFESSQIRDEAIDIITILKKDHINQQLQTLEQEISLAEDKGEKEQVDKLLEKFKELSNQKNLIETNT